MKFGLVHMICLGLCCLSVEASAQPFTCTPSASGPTLIINVKGLKDRKGHLRAELYPDNDIDFLADNDVLVKQGKAFRRVDLQLPNSASTSLCMNTPPPGRYALSVLHDRNLNLKFDIFSDGVGFAGNPVLGRSKPKATQARLVIQPGAQQISITLNYLRGFGFSPLPK